MSENWLPTDDPLREMRLVPTVDFGFGAGVIPPFLPVQYQYFRLFVGCQYGASISYEMRRQMDRIAIRLAHGNDFVRGDLILMASIRWWSPSEPRSYMRRFERSRTRINRKFGPEVLVAESSSEVVPIGAMTLPLQRQHLTCVSTMESGPLLSSPPRNLLR